MQRPASWICVRLRKSPGSWVVNRQCVKTDKASGLVNYTNDWAIETMKIPQVDLRETALLELLAAATWAAVIPTDLWPLHTEHFD